MTFEHTVVRVPLGPRSYDIFIGSGLLSTLGSFIAARCRLTHAAVIADSNVTSYARRTVKELAASGAAVTSHVVPAGESSKSVANAERLWNELLEAGTDRKSVIVAVGGGVIGDLAGFVAATFARGLPFIQVPTTLLADVDSSVGGKVGVNLPHAKNMVGCFWQPSGVLIDIDALSTLPEREYRAGLAEVVKYGVILDADFFSYLESQITAIQRRDATVLRQVVARCCQLKADVVEHDERETTGLRAVLNYGHTFCHAFETVAGYGELLHGEAVSIGMVCAGRLARLLGRIEESFERRQRALLDAFGLPVVVPDLAVEALLAAMRHDKKVEHGRLRFVLPSRMGAVELVGDIDFELVRQAMEDSEP